MTRARQGAAGVGRRSVEWACDCRHGLQADEVASNHAVWQQGLCRAPTHGHLSLVCQGLAGSSWHALMVLLAAAGMHLWLRAHWHSGWGVFEAAAGRDTPPLACVSPVQFHSGSLGSRGSSCFQTAGAGVQCALQQGVVVHSSNQCG